MGTNVISVNNVMPCSSVGCKVLLLVFRKLRLIRSSEARVSRYFIHGILFGLNIIKIYNITATNPMSGAGSLADLDQ